MHHRLFLSFRLHLPSEIVPATHKKSVSPPRPATVRPGGGDDAYRAPRGGNRDGYRSKKDEGLSGEYRPQFAGVGWAAPREQRFSFSTLIVGCAKFLKVKFFVTTRLAVSIYLLQHTVTLLSRASIHPFSITLSFLRCNVSCNPTTSSFGRYFTEFDNNNAVFRGRA